MRTFLLCPPPHENPESALRVLLIIGLESCSQVADLRGSSLYYAMTDSYLEQNFFGYYSYS